MGCNVAYLVFGVRRSCWRIRPAECVSFVQRRWLHPQWILWLCYLWLVSISRKVSLLSPWKGFDSIAFLIGLHVLGPFLARLELVPPLRHIRWQLVNLLLQVAKLDEFLYLLSTTFFHWVATIAVIPTTFREVGFWRGVGSFGHGQNVDNYGLIHDIGSTGSKKSVLGK